MLALEIWLLPRCLCPPPSNRLWADSSKQDRNLKEKWLRNCVSVLGTISGAKTGTSKSEARGTITLAIREEPVSTATFFFLIHLKGIWLGRKEIYHLKTDESAQIKRRKSFQIIWLRCYRIAVNKYLQWVSIVTSLLSGLLVDCFHPFNILVLTKWQSPPFYICFSIVLETASSCWFVGSIDFWARETKRNVLSFKIYIVLVKFFHIGFC